jgi:hypothetical protein
VLRRGWQSIKGTTEPKTNSQVTLEAKNKTKQKTTITP